MVYSLRALLVGVTLSCLFLGWLVENERRQQAALKVITANHGSVQFDDEAALAADPLANSYVYSLRSWLSQMIGADYFDEVVGLRILPPIPVGTSRHYVSSKVPPRAMWNPAPDNTLPMFPKTWLEDEQLTVLSQFTNLRCLEIVGYDVDLSDAALNPIRKLTRLELLDLSLRLRTRLPMSQQFSDDVLKPLCDLKALKSLSIHCRSITDDGLAHLRDLKNLTSLDLRGTGVTQSGLRHLQELSKLTSLQLPSTDITDQGAAFLAKMQRLTFTDSFAFKISDKGLYSLRNLTQNERLLLNQCPAISDEGVKHLQGFQRLRVLSLNGSKITDRALDTICQLKQLRELYIAGTAISEAGLRQLADLPLEILDISYCEFTDAWIAPLQQLPLKQLVAFGSGLTPLAKRQLELKNPALRVRD